MPTDKVMIARPLNCRYCQHAYYGLLHMVNYGQSKGFRIADLAGGECVKDNIYSMLSTDDPQMFFGLGHGSAVSYTDDREATVWSVSSLPPTNLSGRLVYLWSCKTGHTLGPDIIQKGGKAYMGFKENWGWWSVGGPTGDPYDDRLSKWFFIAGNEMVKAMFDGYNWGEAKQKSVDKYNEAIDYWRENPEGDPQAAEYMQTLIEDRDAIVCIGDLTSKLRGAIPCDTHKTQQACIDNGCYWYNGECFSSIDCGQIDNRIDCLNNNCYYYNGSCHSTPPSCEQIIDPQECTDNGCYWWKNGCHTEPMPPDSVIEFQIKSTQIPEIRAYSFAPKYIKCITEWGQAGIWLANVGTGEARAYYRIYIQETGKQLEYWEGNLGPDQDISEMIFYEAVGADHPTGHFHEVFEVGYKAGDNIVPTDSIIWDIELLDC